MYKKKKRLSNAEFLEKKRIKSTVKHAKNNERSQPYSPPETFRSGLTIKEIFNQRMYANTAIRRGWIHSFVKHLNKGKKL